MGSNRRRVILSLVMGIAVVWLLVSLARPVHATFSGKNGRISFLEVNPTGTAVDIYTMNPDGSDEHQLTSLSQNLFVANGAQWSRNGRQLVFPVVTANPVPGQIWVMNADGSNRHMVFTDPNNLDFNTSFSADGKHIVFTRCQAGGQPPCAIYRIRSDGSNLTALTNFDPNPDIVDAFPEYSSDGDRIAFTSLTREGILEAVYVMNADGSDVQRLTPPAIGAAFPDWSPNGERIAFDTNDPFCQGCFFPNPEIWMIDADGDGIKRLSGDPNFLDFNPSWSPQGNAIIFERDDPSSTSSQLLVLNLDDDGASPAVIHKGSTRKSRRAATAKAEPKKNSTASASHLKVIEDDGFTPHWGPAQH
jgi:Tol biopolymer transport system component